MTSIRTPLALLSVAVLGGTLYSVINHTYLDTSDPLVSNLPHPLHASSMFARKTNVFNTVFIKKAWGWTSVAFAAVWLTSPPHARARAGVNKWLAATLVWGAFTAWFFGPAVLERLIVASGGECMLRLPPGQGPGLLAVPPQYCYSRSAVSPMTHPALFSGAGSLDAAWQGGMPRLYRGHDVSGHIFLLTLCVLFLHEQLAPAWRAGSASVVHGCAVAAASGLLGLWVLMCFATSVYWHTPLEKMTGFGGCCLRRGTGQAEADCG